MKCRFILILCSLAVFMMFSACNKEEAEPNADWIAFADMGVEAVPEDGIPHTEEICLTAFNMYPNYEGETVHVKSLVGYETHVSAEFPDLAKQVSTEDGISISYEIGKITHGMEGCEEEISTFVNDDGDEIVYQYVYLEGSGGYQCLYKPVGNPEDEWYLCITINTKSGVEKDEPISENFYDITKDCYYVFENK